MGGVFADSPMRTSGFGGFRFSAQSRGIPHWACHVTRGLALGERDSASAVQRPEGEHILSIRPATDCLLLVTNRHGSRGLEIILQAPIQSMGEMPFIMKYTHFIGLTSRNYVQPTFIQTPDDILQ